MNNASLVSQDDFVIDVNNIVKNGILYIAINQQEGLDNCRDIADGLRDIILANPAVYEALKTERRETGIGYPSNILFKLEKYHDHLKRKRVDLLNRVNHTLLQSTTSQRNLDNLSNLLIDLEVKINRLISMPGYVKYLELLVNVVSPNQPLSKDKLNSLNSERGQLFKKIKAEQSNLKNNEESIVEMRNEVNFTERRLNKLKKGRQEIEIMLDEAKKRIFELNKEGLNKGTSSKPIILKVN